MALVQPPCIRHGHHVYSSSNALSNIGVAHSFTQVRWMQHNAMLSHSKCFSIGMCSLSHKMESQGGLGILKGHIWGPPLWVFTFKDKWIHWVTVSCEWAPSAHTGFLNALQNNLSKPRDTFHSRLMWGQIGSHFNKIPLGWNCISQKARKRCPRWGETRGKSTVEGLPGAFKAYFKRGIYCVDRLIEDRHATGMCRFRDMLEIPLML